MSSRKLQAIILVLLVVVVAGAVSASMQQEKSEYCGSCHTMKPYYESWEKSSHADVECVECHSQRGVGGWIQLRRDLGRMARVERSGAQPDLDIQIADEFCLRCHTKAHNIKEGESLIIPHGLHDAAGLDCASCHGGAVHGDAGEGPAQMTHDTCIACHEGIIADEESCMKCHKSVDLAETANMIIPHDTHSFMSCGSCHGPQAPPEARQAFDMGHDQCVQCHEDIISDPDSCTTCHKAPDVTETAALKIPHGMHVSIPCSQCHGPQLPPEAKAAYVMTHDTCLPCHEEEISDPEECSTCHKTPEVAETALLKIPHDIHSGIECGVCHGPQTPASAKKAWQIGHNTCIACHEDEIKDPAACATCHKTPKVTQTKTLKIPHAAHAGVSCGTCHGPQAPASAKKAWVISHDTCIACHTKWISSVDKCEKCHKTPNINETADIRIPHALHADMVSCGFCHGPEAPPAAKAAFQMGHDQCSDCHDTDDYDTCETCHKWE